MGPVPETKLTIVRKNGRFGIQKESVESVKDSSARCPHATLFLERPVYYKAANFVLLHNFVQTGDNLGIQTFSVIFDNKLKWDRFKLLLWVTAIAAWMRCQSQSDFITTDVKSQDGATELLPIKSVRNF
jgi:hypothetical protein